MEKGFVNSCFGFALFIKSIYSLSAWYHIKDARLLKYSKSIFSITLPVLSSLGRSGMFSIVRNGRLLWKTMYQIMED